MAKRKMPARYQTGPKKGQFKPRGRKASSAPARKRTTRKRTTRKRTTTMRKAAHSGVRRRTVRRRNPDIVKTLTKGVEGAALVMGGEVATSALPRMVGLPALGPTGVAAQAAVALVVGMVADRFFGAQRGAYVLAGALAVPLRSLLIGAEIPVVSDALRSGMSAYVMPRVTRSRVGPVPVASYVQPARALGSYVQPANRAWAAVGA